MNRSRLILALLAPLVILAVISAWLRMPRQQRVDRLAFRQLSSATGQPAAVPKGNRMELPGDLEAPSVITTSVHRNIFKPLTEEQAAAVIRGGGAVPSMRVRPAPAPPAPPSQQELARRQLNSFTVLGSYVKKGTRIVFMAKGEEIITVRVGDMLIPGYQVIAIDDERMTLRSQDGTHQLIATL